MEIEDPRAPVLFLGPFLNKPADPVDPGTYPYALKHRDHILSHALYRDRFRGSDLE